MPRRRSWPRWSGCCRTYRLPLDEVVPVFAALLSLPPARRTTRAGPEPAAAATEDPGSVAGVAAGGDGAAAASWWCGKTCTGRIPLPWSGSVCSSTRPLPARLLTLLTCRPEFRPPWASRSHLTQLTLSRFTRPQVEAMVTHVAGGKALPARCCNRSWPRPMVCPCSSKS